MRDDHDPDGPPRVAGVTEAGDPVEATPAPDGSPISRAFGALMLGMLAGAIGAGIDMGLTVALGQRFFVIPLLIGMGVGWGVRLGARGQGGWTYQVAAVVLGYLAMVAGHLPLLPVALRGEFGWPGEVLLLLVMPIYQDVNSIAGLAMILLGLFQAWRLNRCPPEPTRPAALTIGGEGAGEAPTDA